MLIQNKFGLTGSLKLIWPATPSANPSFANTRKAAAICDFAHFRSSYLSSNLGTLLTFGSLCSEGFTGPDDDCWFPCSPCNFNEDEAAVVTSVFDAMTRCVQNPTIDLYGLFTYGVL